MKQRIDVSLSLLTLFPSLSLNSIFKILHDIEEGCHPQVEQPKVLSAVEDRMDELGASIAQSRRTVALIKVRPGPNP